MFAIIVALLIEMDFNVNQDRAQQILNENPEMSLEEAVCRGAWVWGNKQDGEWSWRFEDAMEALGQKVEG